MAKHKKKRTNPRSQPVNQADLKRAKAEAVSEAVEFAWAILFNVLCDKEGYHGKDLQRVWNEVNELSEAVAQGYVNIADLKHVLRTEQGADLK